MKKKGFTCSACKAEYHGNPHIFVPFIRNDDKQELSAERLTAKQKSIGLKVFCKDCAATITNFFITMTED